MMDILKSLLFRLKKSTSFYVLLILTAAMPLLSLLLYSVLGSIEEFAMLLDMQNIPLGTLTDTISISGDVALFTLIATSIFLSKEFVDGTIRNTILANKRRTDIYFAYLLAGMIIAVVYVLTFYVVTLLVLGISFGFGGTSFFDAFVFALTNFAISLFTALFIVSCVTLFVIATGKQSTSIVFPLLICIFAPGIIQTVVETIAMFTQMSDGSILDTTWIPFVNVLNFTPPDVKFSVVGPIVLYYALFDALFIFLGGFVAIKRDLK